MPPKDEFEANCKELENDFRPPSEEVEKISAKRGRRRRRRAAAVAAAAAAVNNLKEEDELCIRMLLEKHGTVDEEIASILLDLRSRPSEDLQSALFIARFSAARAAAQEAAG